MLQTIQFSIVQIISTRHFHEFVFLGSSAGCGDLNNPTNGHVTVKKTETASLATYSCSTGFSLQGTKHRFCIANTRWSGTAPSCTGIC